ncbi:GatB/YqeY domain-containing protein [bacterium]|nr:GatB/YqeY domain-containing protein [bacterium]
MLHQTIKESIKDAMRAKDTLRLETLRSIVAACTNELVASRRMPQETLTDEEVLAVVKRLGKQRKDSIEQFEKGGREDLADKEKAELVILESFLPKMPERDEIKKVAEAKKIELGITDKSKAGQLVGAVMKELKGQADGGAVKEVVDGLF